MKDKRIKEGRLVALLLALVATMIASLGSVSLNGYLPEWAVRLFPIVAGGLVYLLLAYVLRRGAPEEKTQSVAKILSLVFAGLLATCVYTAVRSLWISPWDPSINRFVYENTATATGFLAIVLVFALSAIQKDIYWVSRKKTVKLDERELKERQEVFERSYKLGAFLVLGTVYLFIDNLVNNIPRIIAIDSGLSHAIPGHFYWLPASLVITMFALPLVVAAWKKH